MLAICVLKRLLSNRISKFVGVRGVTLGRFVGRDMLGRCDCTVGLVVGTAVVAMPMWDGGIGRGGHVGA